MQLGLVGLGRMGGNMRERLRERGHEVFGYDRNQDISDAASLAEMVEKLNPPRVVWANPLTSLKSPRKMRARSIRWTPWSISSPPPESAGSSLQSPVR